MAQSAYPPIKEALAKKPEYPPFDEAIGRSDPVDKAAVTVEKMYPNFMRKMPAFQQALTKAKRDVLGEEVVFPALRTQSGWRGMERTAKQAFETPRHPDAQEEANKAYMKHPSIGASPPGTPPEKAFRFTPAPTEEQRNKFEMKPRFDRTGLLDEIAWKKKKPPRDPEADRTKTLGATVSKAIDAAFPKKAKRPKKPDEYPPFDEALAGVFGPQVEDPTASDYKGAAKALGKQAYKGAASELGATLDLLDTPFRALGGAAKGTQENLKWGLVELGREMGWLPTEGTSAGEKPMSVWERTAKSTTGELPVHLSDVNEDAIKAWTGRDELTEGERLAALLAGVATEIVVGGRAMPRFGGGVKGQQAGKQIGLALKKAGAKVEPKSFEKIGFEVMSKEGAPKRIAEARRFIQRASSKYKIDPAKADEIFRRIIGREGVQMGKRGMTTRGGREILRRPMARARNVQDTGPLPFGAGYGGKLGPAGRSVAAQVKYGAATPEGVMETLRQAQAETGMGVYEAFKGAKDIETVAGGGLFKKLGLGGRRESERVAKIIDSEFIKSRLPQETKPLLDDLEAAIRAGDAKKISSIDNLVHAKHKGAQKAIDALGLSADEIKKGVSGLAPGQQGLVKDFRKSFDDMFAKEITEGIDVGYLDDMISRVETRASKKAHFERPSSSYYGGKRPGYTKHRLGLEAGVGLGGTKTREFYTRLSDIWSARVKGHALSMANAKAENNILKQYGRELVDELEIAKLEQLHPVRNYGVYEAKVGNFKGKKFLLDKETKKLLDRMVDPNMADRALAGMDKLTAYWKSRATIFRPGFAVRNILFGNMWQLHLADVDIFRTMPQAARVMSRRFAKSQFGTMRHRAFLDDMVNALGKKGGKSKKIGKHTIDEWIDIAEQNKVFGGGFFGSELGNVGRVTTGGLMKNVLRGANPLGSQNVVMRGVASFNRMGEDMARLTLFMDSVRKGHAPGAAAARVAKYIFNYDELSRTMKAARSAFPFWTWNYKNWGLEVQSLLTKPDKFATAAAAFRAGQELDRLDPEAALLERDAGPQREHGMWFRTPGLRGDKGGRMYLPLGGLWPGASLQNLDPDYVVEDLGSMLHPLWQYAAGALRKEEGESLTRYSRHTEPPQFRESGTVLAPSWVDATMERAKDLGLHDKLTSLFQPQYEQMMYLKNKSDALDRGKSMDDAYRYADRNTPILHYRWDESIETAIRAADPGFHKINSLLRARTDDETHDRFLAYLFGVKPFEWNTEKAKREHGYANKWFQNKLKAIDQKSRQMGKEVKSEYDVFRR